MDLVNELFAELDINKENTIKFFIVFARFEYALKRGSFAKFIDGGK
jgi:hypothetical protein